MPCYRCGTRQVDPDRGSSPWLRGVRADRQVLICPGCQAGPDWADDLDRCTSCGSTRLVRRLGETECRDCGTVGEATTQADADAGPECIHQVGPDAVPPGLAAEVEQALAKVLRRSGVPAPII
jgi:hypothetical protein